MNGLLHFSFIGPGGPEILVVMLALLVMFGSRDAPRIFRKINEILSQIRSTAEHFRHEMMYSDLNPEAASKSGEGEYDDYGQSADTDAEFAAEDEAEPGAKPGGDADQHGDDDVKPV